MRIVPNLRDMTECPNCGESLYLRETKDDEGKPYVLCINCHEECYENEQSAPSEEEVARVVQCLIDAGFEPDPNGMTISEMADKFIKKEKVLFELREMADVLPHYAHDANTTFLMQMIRDIFNKLIDYLEEN